MNEARPLTLAGVLVVEADSIARRDLHLAGGLVADAPAAGTAVLDARDLVAYPGLVNAHDHLHLNSVPPPAPRTWPNAYAWIEAFQPHFQEPAVRRALEVPLPVRAAHGGLKNLLAGATTVAHHDPWLPVFEERAFPAHVVAGYGWSHSLGLDYGPPVAEGFAATPPGRPFMIHLAEGTDARAAGELEALARQGALDERGVLVHGVGFTPGDVARILEAGAAVVWCPASNLALLGATLDPLPLARAGRLALGTDSRLSGSRDLLEEMKVARSVGGCSPRDVFRLVTRGGAAVLKEPLCGGLAPGQRADLLLLRAGGDPYEALLTAGRADLAAVLLGGRPLLADAPLERWLAAGCVDARPVRLDGREKVLWAAIAPEVLALEPGLEPC